MMVGSRPSSAAGTRGLCFCFSGVGRLSLSLLFFLQLALVIGARPSHFGRLEPCAARKALRFPSSLRVDAFKPGATFAASICNGLICRAHPQR
jgi:hypothetical protein